MKCYYDNKYCNYIEKLWQCKTCGECFCTFHWHETDLGSNVECVACEDARRREKAEGKEESMNLYDVTISLTIEAESTDEVRDAIDDFVMDKSWIQDYDIKNIRTLLLVRADD